MTPFIVVTSDKLIVDAIRSVYSEEHFKYAQNVWLVVDNGVTARDVYRKLIASLPQGEEKDVTVLLCSVAGYFGRARKDLWEWLAAKGSAV